MGRGNTMIRTTLIEAAQVLVRGDYYGVADQ